MSPSNDLEKLVEDRVTFTCVVEGIPTPNVTWYHNGENPPGVTSVSGSNHNINTLTITSGEHWHVSVHCRKSSWQGSGFVGLTGQNTRCGHYIQAHYISTCGMHSTSSPPPTSSVIMAVSSSSSDIHAMDTGLGLPLLVAATDGGDAVLFAVVTADPCPTIQWMVNGSNIGRAGYTLNNPCSSPPGTTSFNFTLTITATSVRTGTYSATLTNPAGTVNVPPVFVTPPGMLTVAASQGIHLGVSTLLMFLVLYSSSGHH